jgi:hypothetical protein
MPRTPAAIPTCRAPLHDREDFRRALAELFDRTFSANPFAR